MYLGTVKAMFPWYGIQRDYYIKKWSYTSYIIHEKHVREKTRGHEIACCIDIVHVHVHDDQQLDQQAIFLKYLSGNGKTDLRKIKEKRIERTK